MKMDESPFLSTCFSVKFQLSPRGYFRNQNSSLSLYHSQFLETLIEIPRSGKGEGRLRMPKNAGNQSRRQRPNILITGTPGTGKTTTSAALAEAANLRHINIGDLVKEKNLHDGWDEEFECYIINDDLVCDELEDLMEEGGIIVDHHGCDFFPERWFDRVVVLQAENSVLYDRLTKRGYTGKKLSNNIECEIFQVLLEEAKESYAEDIVVALKSDCIDDMDRNVSVLTDWVRSWSSLS